MHESQAPSSDAKLSPARRLALILGLLGSFLIVCFLVAMTIILPGEAPPPVQAKFLLPAGADAWKEGRAAYDTGDFEKAVEYWRQVPKDDPNRGRALRYIGWEVYASEVGEPRKALRYVNRCALENPLDGNTWQDLGRTYAAVVGIDL
jgi:tetratricopeptide (TPR) repeat protein